MLLKRTRTYFWQILLSACCLTAVNVSAQSQLQTVRGKTKDGKEIKVDYYKGPVEDYVASVKYQLVDELRSKVRSLESELARRDSQLDTLYSLFHRSEKLDGLLSMKEIEIDSINTAITALNVQIDALQTAREKLMAQQGKSEARAFTMSFIGLPAKTPVIGLTVSAGPVVPDKHGDGMRVKDFRWQEQAGVYVGTARWGKWFPFSMEIGAAWRRLTMLSPVRMTNMDGIAVMDAIHEKMELTSVEVPVLCCFGQPASDRVTAFFRLGATPSFRLNGEISGDTQPFRSLADASGETPGLKKEVRPFNLWAHAAFGTYIPFSCLSRARYASSLVFKAGVRCEYAVWNLLKDLGTDMTANAFDAFGAWRDLKVYLPALELGLVYTLK